MQSRYYNPQWRRFINADDTSILLATKGTLLGSNLFAYCENNPVNKVDFSGRESTVIIKIVSIIIALAIMNMSFGDRVENVFPCYYISYFDENTGKYIQKKEIYCRAFDYYFDSRLYCSFLRLRGVFLTHLGLRYFDAEIEIRDRTSWKRIINRENILTDFDALVEPLTTPLGQLLPPEGSQLGLLFSAEEMSRAFITKVSTSISKYQKEYIRYELSRQYKYSKVFACILNQYSSYGKKNILGQEVHTNYIKHDCAKEFWNSL